MTAIGEPKKVHKNVPEPIRIPKTEPVRVPPEREPLKVKVLKTADWT